MSVIDPKDPSSSPDTRSEARRMLELLSIAPTHSGWLPTELGPILAHQLDVPLSEIVEQRLPETQQSGSQNLRTLFANASPPIDLLKQLKDFFKRASVDESESLPREVATVLYIAILCLARNVGATLTRLDDAALADRVDWASSRRWLEPILARLFHQFNKDRGAGS